MSEHDPETKRSKCQAITIDNLIFSEKGREESRLHQVLTSDADINIQECAMITELQDTHLLTYITAIKSPPHYFIWDTRYPSSCLSWLDFLTLLLYQFLRFTKHYKSYFPSIAIRCNNITNIIYWRSYCN